MEYRLQSGETNIESNVSALSEISDFAIEPTASDGPNVQPEEIAKSKVLH